jgi:hypothetical protein
MGGRRGAYRILMGKSKGKRLLGRPTCKWDDIKIHLTEIGQMDMD